MPGASDSTSDLLKKVGKVPLLGSLGRRAVVAVRSRRFEGSSAYWEQRYGAGGDSGDGSYGRLAEYKASVLNEFVERHGVQSVIELGCGDGHQLSLATYPTYIGIEPSPSARARCESLFADDPTRQFAASCEGRQAELALSLDVIFHLVEDEVYEAYMRDLVGAGTSHLIVYSSDEDAGREAAHVRHRKFTRWIEANAPMWRLVERLDNPYAGSGGSGTSFSDFFIYERAD